MKYRKTASHRSAAHVSKDDRVIACREDRTRTLVISPSASAQVLLRPAQLPIATGATRQVVEFTQTGFLLTALIMPRSRVRLPLSTPVKSGSIPLHCLGGLATRQKVIAR